MLKEFNFDLQSIEENIQNIAKDARREALIEIEQDTKFPEIIRVFQNVCK
ncbi:MAG: hypothetical protein WCF95_00960 [bacterium]